MGNYPEFFYTDLPSDPCDTCACLVDGNCICCDGCCYCRSEDVSGAENRPVGSDSVFSNDDLII